MQLPWTGIGDLGCCHIAEGLRQNSALRTVDLSGNNAGYSSCLVVAETLGSNTALERLVLNYNPLSQVLSLPRPQWPSLSTKNAGARSSGRAGILMHRAGRAVAQGTRHPVVSRTVMSPNKALSCMCFCVTSAIWLRLLGFNSMW